MIKKLFALMLVLCLLLAGCGKSSQPPAGTIKPAETAPVTQAPTTEPTVETAPVTEPTVETTPVTEPAEENPVPLGRMEGGIYENSYAGFGCSLDAGWSYKTAEELQDISALADDLLEGSAIDLSGSNLTQVTDMMAENTEYLVSMNVLYQQVTPQEKLLYSLMEESEIIDHILLSKDALISSYSQAGIDVSSMEKVSGTFLEETRYAIYTIGAIQETPYYILQVFNYQPGSDYAVILTLSSFVEDNTVNMLNLFYPVS